MSILLNLKLTPFPMKTHRPATAVNPTASAPVLGEIPASTAQYWRPVPTQLHDARLYCFAVSDAGTPDWQAEITVLGVEVSRRFDSEANARAWLATLQAPDVSSVAPHREPSPVSWTAVVRHRPTFA
jgi:hypothetical protein